MADNININKALDLEPVIKQLERLIPLMDKLYTSTNGVNTAITNNENVQRKATTAAKEKKVTLTEVQKLEKQNVASLEKLNALSTKEAQSLARTRLAIQEKNKQTKQEIQLNKAAGDSLTAQRIKLAKMKKEYADAALVQQKKLLPALKKQNELIKEQEKAYGDNQRDVANYAGQLDGLTNNMGGAISGFKMMVMQAKAFIATPLGLVLAVIAGAVALVAKAFKSSQPLMDAFERTSKALSAALAVVTDRIANFLENLRGGETSLKDFGDAIVQNVINRFKSMGKFAKAIGLALKGDFKEAAEEAKEASIQLATGLDEVQQQKVAETIKGITKEIKEETKAASTLEGARQKLRDEEIASIQTLAMYNQELQRNRLLAKDQTKSDEERLAALQAAQQAETKSTDIRVRLATERARILQSERDLGKSTAEEIREAEEASAAAIEARTESYRTQQRILSELSGFQKTIATEREKAIESEFEAEADLQLAKDSAYEADLERNQLELDAAQELANEKLEIHLEEIAKKQAANEELKNASIAIANELFNYGLTLGDKRIANIEAQVEAEKITEEEGAKQIAAIQKKQAVAEKAQALFNIGLSTAEAVTKALPNIPLSILMGVLGGAQAATVLATPIPQYFKGTESAQRGLVMYGEKGTEAVERADGSVYFTPDHATYGMMSGGERILTADKTKQKYGSDNKGVEQRLDKLNRRKDRGLTQGQFEKSMSKMSRRSQINVMLSGK